MVIRHLSLLTLVSNIALTYAGGHAVANGPGYGRSSRTTTSPTLYSPSTKRTTSPAPCQTTVTVTKSKTVTPVHSIAYSIDVASGESSIGFEIAYNYQVAPSTVYPYTTTVTAAAMTTVTDTTTSYLATEVIETSTITVPTPSGWLPIQGSLPNATRPAPDEMTSTTTETFDPNNLKRQVSTCEIVTSTVFSISTLPATTITPPRTPTGNLYSFETPVTCLDAHDLSKIFSALAHPTTITATTPSTLTSFLAEATTTQTTVIQSTQTLYTDKYIYDACRDPANFADRITDGPGPQDYVQITISKPVRGLEFARLAYPYGKEGCCAAAQALPGAAYWVSYYSECYVKLIDAESSCVPSANNFTIDYLHLDDWPEKYWAGNGPCGGLTDKKLSPSAGLGTG